MADDDLTKAAQRAHEVLPGPIADLVVARLAKRPNSEETMGGPNLIQIGSQNLAAAVLALPTPAPAVDRETLKAALAPHRYRSPADQYGYWLCECGVTYTSWTDHLADALISRGVVTTGQRDGVAAVDLAGILTLAADLGTESWQEMADHLLSRFEIHERTPGQRDGGEPHGTR